MQKVTLLVVAMVVAVSCTPGKNKAKAMVPKILYSLGKLKVEESTPDEAMLYFAKAVELEPGQIESIYGLGYCYTLDCTNNARSCDSAIACFNYVIKYDPLHRKVYYNRGVVLEHLGKYQEALRDYSYAIYLNNKDADYYYARGNTFRKLKRRREAINDYRDAECLGHSSARKWIDRLERNDYLEE